MKYKITSRFQRISPRKLMAIRHLIKDRKAEELQQSLIHRPEKGSRLIFKLINSALDSAKSKDADIKSLKIKNIIIDVGPKLKRRKIKARGRADVVEKRYCHITLILEDKRKKPDKVKKEKKEIDNKDKSGKVNKSKARI